MKRIVGRVVLAIVIAVAVVYAVDWTVWRLRGRATGTVQVTWFAVAELKGSKEEFYPDGEGPVSCSQSIFPQGGWKPCWWVVKHPVVFER